MGAIENFLKRWGFAKLDRYGLVLTPDDRVMSTRPAILDDGLGGKIVGWNEGDLAAMELEKWAPPRRASTKPKKLIAAPASLHKLPPAPPQAARTIAPAAPIAAPAPAPIAAAPIAAPVIAPTPIPVRAPAPAPVVAESEEPGEDEWEWEIAMARARATAADEIASPAIARPVVPRKTSQGMAVVKATLEPDPLPPWPGTEPFNESWADKSEVAPHVMSVLQKKLAADKRTPPKAVQTVAPPTVAPQRSTVIPVPQLPSAADPRSVRPAQRVARGTGAPSKVEETVRTNAAPAANDDRTSPYITLPSEVKPSGFAHTKRVAAKLP
jgi:hypothetical protein